MAATAAAALGGFASAATPPKLVGNANIKVTLRIVAGSKTVRTVRFQTTASFNAEDRRLWLAPGYWAVDIMTRNLADTRKLCRPKTCTDSEPGNELLDAPFNNLLATTTSPSPDRRMIVLRGHMAMSGSASFTDVTAWNWYTRTRSAGLGFLHTPRPVAVVAGQRVYFVIEVSLPAGDAVAWRRFSPPSARRRDP